MKFAFSVKPGDMTGFGQVAASRRALDGKSFTLVLSNGTEVQVNRFKLIRTKRGH